MKTIKDYISERKITTKMMDNFNMSFLENGDKDYSSSCIRYPMMNNEYRYMRLVNDKHVPYVKKGTEIAPVIHKDFGQDNESYIFIMEGESDALVMGSYFKNVVSVLGSTNVSSLFKNQKFLNYFDQIFPTIVLCFDNDKAGKDACIDFLGRSPSLRRQVNIIRFPFNHFEGCNDLREVLQQAKPPTKDKLIELLRQSPLAKSTINEKGVLSFDDFMAHEFPPNEPILDGLIHKGEMIALVAKGKVGKSLFALNIVDSLMSQREFLKKFTPEYKPRVLYLNGEISQGAFKGRLTSLMNEDEFYQYKDNFYISASNFDLSKDDPRKNLMNVIKRFKIELLILDPLFQYFSGNEMDQQAVKNFIAPLRRELLGLKCSCLLVCHEGKTNESERGHTNIGHTIRGSSVLSDTVDGTIRISKTELGFSLFSEFRNREPFETLSLTREGIAYKFNGVVQSQRKIRMNTIEKIVSTHPGSTLKEIYKVFKEKFQGKRSESSIRKDLKNHPNIKESQDGKRKIYSLKVEEENLSNFQTLKEDKSLNDDISMKNQLVEYLNEDKEE